ncbi:MAG: Gfo/Idh/MocA family oxidoreductase [bacterium]|nr:Gfo/Idh/MocA family oxidoreductase [bacterium]
MRRTKRIVQVGTQRRSSPFFIEARSHMKEIGDVHLVNSWWLNYSKDLRRRKLEGKLDWEKWLGPARKRDLDPARFFNWYYFRDYGGGMLTGQASHIVDAINMFMGSGYPTAVTCSGGRVNVKGAEITETASMSSEYPENYLAIFTIGYKAMHYRWFNDQLKQFHGTKARLDVAREWYKLWPQSEENHMKPSIEVDRLGSFEPASRAHIRNLLDCVKDRKEPNATVEMGQWTNVSLSMALESMRTGRRMRFNTDTKRMV